MRAGAAGRPEPTVARQSSPELAVFAEFALPLPSLFLTSLAGVFGFGAGDAGGLGGCLPATVAPVLADVALPLPSSFLTSFLTSIAGAFGFGAHDAGGLATSLPAATRSSSRGTSIAKRPGWRMRPAMRPALSPAPQ